MDSKQLKHLADQQKFSIENDPIYSAIKYHTELENLLNELRRNDYKKEGGTPDQMEQICLSSLALRQSNWDFLDSRYFKSFWSGGGQLFEVPPFIDKAEYNKAEIRLRIMAANIAVRLNTETEEFDSYLSDRKKNGNWLDKYFDQLFFFSLGVTQEISGNLTVLIKYLEEYIDTDFGRRWIDDHLNPTINFCIKLPQRDAVTAIIKWRDRFDLECMKYYPVQRHYGKGSTAKGIAINLRDFLIDDWRIRFERVAAGYVNQESIIRNELRTFKLKYFGSEDDAVEMAVHHHKIDQDFDLSVNANFNEILKWAETKAAAIWIGELADFSVTNRAKRNTDLTLREFGTLAYFLKDIGLFESQKEAIHHLAMFYRWQNENGMAIDMNERSLLNLKYRDIEVAEKLFNSFLEITKTQNTSD